MQAGTYERYKKYITGLLDIVFDDSNEDSREVKLETIEELFDNEVSIDSSYPFGYPRVYYYDDGPFRYYDFGYSGGEQITDVGYWDFYNFEEGFGLGQTFGGWFYIDVTGKHLNSKGYEKAMPFHEGFARVSNTNWLFDKNIKWFYIDRTGKRINDEEYDEAEDFKEGKAHVKKGERWFYIVGTCPELFDEVGGFLDGIAVARKGGKWFYIDKAGKRINAEEYDGATAFYDGLARVKKDGKWFYIDTAWKRINNEEYDDAWNFQDGKAHVKKGERWFYIVGTSPELFDEVGDFHEGVVAVKKDGKWFYVDQTGKRINTEEYDEVEDFQAGKAHVKKGGKWFFIVGTSPELFDEVGDFHEGLVAVKKDGKWFYVDQTGERLNNEEYDEGEDFHAGKAHVKKGERWFYIVGTSPELFDEVGDFHEGLVAVKKDGKWFYVDQTGERLNDEEYDYVENFHEGFGIVRVNNKYFYIDKNGRRINSEGYDVAKSFNNGIAYVKQGDQRFYINRSGKKILDFNSYKICGMDENGAVKIMQNNQCNAIDYETGELLFLRWYDTLEAVTDYKGRVIPGYFFTQSFGAKPQLQIIGDGKIATLIVTGKVVITNNLIIADNVVKPRRNEMRDYEVFRGISGYKCKSSTDNFKIKYQPIKCYGTRYVLCVDNKQMYLYDRTNNKYIPLGDCIKIEYDDNIIVDGTNKKIYLIYDGNLIDITEYYREHLKGKKGIHITDGIKGFMDEKTFLDQIITDIDKSLDAERKRSEEARRQKAALRETERLEAEKQKEALEREEAEKAKREVAMKAWNKLKKAILKYVSAQEKLQKSLYGLKYISRTEYDYLFIEEGDHLIIDPDFVEFIKFIDLANYDFANVQVDGVDFRGCNLNAFDPQKVYQRNLRGCNFDKLCLSAFKMNFTGVDIRGCHFSEDDDPRTYDEFPVSFEKAIYDDTTTYNGVSLVKIIEQWEVTRRSGEGRQ